MRIDREAGLDVGGGEVAIAFGRLAEARILVPGEIAGRARRLPVDLVDDLLDVAPDQRLEQSREARIEPHRVERRPVIGRPLHHLHQRAALALRDLVEEIAVAEAAAVRHAFGMDGSISAPIAATSSAVKKPRTIGIAVAVPGGGSTSHHRAAPRARHMRQARAPAPRRSARRSRPRDAVDEHRAHARPRARSAAHRSPARHRCADRTRRCRRRRRAAAGRDRRGRTCRRAAPCCAR